MGKITKCRFGLYFALISLIFAGCRPIKSTRNSFSKTEFCYRSTLQALANAPIKFQGYYHIKQGVTVSRDYPPQTQSKDIVSDIVFFNDGSFVYTFNPKDLDGLLWGTYIIEQDTIKGHFIEPPRGMSWEAGYVWFKIIDQNSIKELHYKYRTPIVLEEIAEKRNEDMPTGQFISLDSSSYQEVYKKNWLKHRKWYWCNEEDFKKWQTQNKKR